jgi:ABC-type sulfate/molybdate transport systems ATPase subunit/ABC-type sulfate transport system permease component
MSLARRGRGLPSPLVWLGALVVLYLTIPVVTFAIRLIRSDNRGFGTPGLFRALWVSCESATISLVLIAVFGIPLAYVLARSHGRLATVVSSAVALPLAVPPVMGGILLIYLVGPYTSLGQFFDRRLTDSLTGVVFAQTFVAAPFLVITARAAFAAIEPGYEEVAATLGHRPIVRFLRVGLPLAAGGIRAGLLLSWLRAFGEYGATVLLAYHPTSLPVYTYTQFSASGLPTTQAPTALAFAAAAVVIVLVRIRVPSRSPDRRSLPAPAAPPARMATPVAFDLDRSIGSFHLRATHRATTPRLAILGRSGSGKSMTLRSLAGLLGPGAGRVWYGPDDVTAIPPERRRVGYVPQGYALLPHLDVWAQVCFGVGADPALAAYWLEVFHLGGLAGRRPDQLSGGQRQRVCLAQALSRQPRLLLLDEPFSALDTPVRDELRHEVRRLQFGEGLSSVLVTHDPEEAALLADEILVLADGRLVQAGSAARLHAHPATADVARLLGIANVLPGHVGPGGGLVASGVAIPTVALDLAPGTAVEWCVHPEHVEIGAGAALPATVVDAAELGAATALRLQLGPGVQLRARISGRRRWQVGEACRVDLPADVVAVWPAQPDLAAPLESEAAESTHT